MVTQMTRDVAVERTAFSGGRALVLFGAALVAVNIVFDYAKIRLVVEDRRSVVRCAASGDTIPGRHPGRRRLSMR